MVHDEVVRLLRPATPPVPAPGRDDAWDVTVTRPLRAALELRTAVAVWIRLVFAVPRPRSLTSGDHLARIVAAMRAAQVAAPSSSFRFEAAGRDSAAFARLGAELARATGLPHDDEAGELVVRVRRGARLGGDDPGWEVLVRVGPRPLSARSWRAVDFPGAANATIAAAMARLGGVRPDDRVANLMCGSGTLLVERLLAGRAAAAVGVDRDASALAAARANLRAAGLPVADEHAALPAPGSVRLVHGDATEPGLLGDERFDLILADPPWGTLHGTHAQAPALHAALLHAAHALAAPGARLVVLTHEVVVMTQAVRDADALWRPRQSVRVFAKGHHPRIWVLDRAS